MKVVNQKTQKTQKLHPQLHVLLFEAEGCERRKTLAAKHSTWCQFQKFRQSALFRMGGADIGDTRVKECRSIVRDESSVYFNVTAKHV